MLFRRFLQDGKASVATMAALGLIPIVASVGAAVDIGRADMARAKMQGALDASALAIARDAKNASADQLNENATNYFNVNFRSPDITGVRTQVATSSTSGGYLVSMSATGSVQTKFMSIVGVSAFDVSVRSNAVSYMDGLGCVLSLDQHASGAVNGPGTASVALNGCSLYDNSDNATALTVGGSTEISALSVGVVGNLTGAANITTTHGIKTKIAPVRDPYSEVSFPPFSGCTAQNFSAHDTTTIDPGVYCGGMTINAGGTVTLNPGIYYLDGGSLSVNGGATLTGNGVTLVFTSQNRNGFATASINGNATINLMPPTAGPTAGIVMFGDRRIPTGSSFKFNGGATQYLGGAVYLPTAAIDFAGGFGTNTSCTQLIGDSVTFTGSSALALNCDSYGTAPFSPLIVRLSS